MRYLSENVRFKFGFECGDDVVTYDKVITSRAEYELLNAFLDYWDYTICDLMNSDKLFQEHNCTGYENVEIIVELLDKANRAYRDKLILPLSGMNAEEAKEASGKDVLATLMGIYGSVTRHFGFDPYFASKDYYGALSFTSVKREAQVEITRRRAEELLTMLTQRNYRIKD